MLLLQLSSKMEKIRLEYGESSSFKKVRSSFVEIEPERSLSIIQNFLYRTSTSHLLRPSCVHTFRDLVETLLIGGPPKLRIFGRELLIKGDQSYMLLKQTHLFYNKTTAFCL